MIHHCSLSTSHELYRASQSELISVPDLAREIGDRTDALRCRIGSTHRQGIRVVDLGWCKPDQPALRVECFDTSIGFLGRELLGHLVECRKRRPGVLPVHVYDASLLQRADAGGRKSRALVSAQASSLQQLDGHLRYE